MWVEAVHLNRTQIACCAIFEMHKELQRVELQIVKSLLEEPSNSSVQLVSVLTSTVRIFLTLGSVLQLQISVEVCVT